MRIDQVKLVNIILDELDFAGNCGNKTIQDFKKISGLPNETERLSIDFIEERDQVIQDIMTLCLQIKAMESYGYDIFPNKDDIYVNLRVEIKEKIYLILKMNFQIENLIKCGS